MKKIFGFIDSISVFKNKFDFKLYIIAIKLKKIIKYTMLVIEISKIK